MPRLLVLHGTIDDEETEAAVLVASYGSKFSPVGPVFDDREDAESFLEWLGNDDTPWLWAASTWRRVHGEWLAERDWLRCSNHDLSKGGCTGRARPERRLCDICHDDVSMGGAA